MGNDEEVKKEIEKLLGYIREKHITLSKQGKQRLIRKFPSLKDEIVKIEETRNNPKRNEGK